MGHRPLKLIPPLIGGKGGGTAASAQGGGVNIAGIPAALAQAKQNIIAIISKLD